MPQSPTPRRATIVTLAQAAGVAPSTVSRALKGDTRISPEMRARIARLAKESGYTPHASARTLSSGRSGLVGIVIGQAQNLLYTELLHEAVRQAAARGIRLLLIHAGAGPIEDQLADALLQYQVDGCLVASAELPSHVTAVCRANGVPIVMVNRVARLHASAVSCDNHGGGMMAADVLLGAGHRRIGLVRTSSSTSPGQERDRGFTDRLAVAGLQPVLRLDGRSTYEGAFTMGQQIAALRPAERPSALFVVSDIMAFGVLQALRQGGVRVPRDIAVIGFDGLPQSGWAAHDLTTIEQPLPAMLGRALDLLQARMMEPGMPDETVTLRGRLVVRGSTG